MKKGLSGNDSLKLVTAIPRHISPAAHLVLRTLGGIGHIHIHTALVKMDLGDLAPFCLMSHKTCTISEHKKLRQENKSPGAATVGR
jgi:hypothetical protein